MKTPLVRSEGVEAPRCIAEILNLMIVTMWAQDLAPAANGDSQVPSIKSLAEKRRMIMKGTCDPFGALIPLGENALSMGVKPTTVKAPYLQALAHFDVVAQRREAKRARALYVYTDRETVVNQALDRVQHRALRDENNIEVLREVARLADAQATESLVLRDAARERIAELLMPAKLNVAVRWTRGTRVGALS